MRFPLPTLGLLLLLAMTSAASAGIEVRSFTSAEQEARYRHLIGEMRCLVCQNESLAASNASLAQDLRQEIYEMVQAGKPEREIVAYMVRRYGDFVLYRPPFKPTTALLWLGPLLFLLIAGITAWRLLRRGRQPATTPPPAIDPDRVRALLEEDPEDRG